VLLGLFYLSQSSHVLATGYVIDSLQVQLAEARARQAQLVYRIGEARSPAVIERAARGRLRLVQLPATSVGFAGPQPSQVATAIDATR
jgi:hypothetical protein